MDQLGIAGAARYWGIPAAVVSYNGRSGTAHTLALFTKVDKSPGADIAKSNDIKGELQAMNRTNKTIQLSFSAKPTGAKGSDALAIAGDLPLKNAPMTITADGSTVAGVVTEADPDLHCPASGNDTLLIEDAKLGYTPEGEAVIDFTVTRHISKKFVALADS